MSEQDRTTLFIEALEQRRRVLGMNHREFALHLGRSEGNWSLVRRGRRRVSLDFARAVIGRWPEFGGYWAADLAAGGPGADADRAERR